MRHFLSPLLLAALVLTGARLAPPAAADSAVAYFPATGHTLELGFAQFVAEHGGTALFGPPITEEISENGLVVQYFQHLRLEWHADQPAGRQIVVGPLGMELKKAQPAVPPGLAGPGAVYDAVTGHRLANGFLRFYRAHDGATLLGSPISEEVPDGAAVVQYFTRAELRYQPGLGVSLGDLGVEAAKARGWIAGRPPLAPVPAPPKVKHPAPAPAAPDSLAAPASPEAAAIPAAPLPGGRGRLEVPVLMYHHIGPWPSPYSVSAPNFAAQLAWLHANGYQGVTLRQLFAALYGPAPLPTKPVVITIDDGYDDAATTARQLLGQFHTTATFFIPTWQTRLSPATLRAMDAEGFDIEAHSRTHPDLTSLGEATAWDEIDGSKRDLERILGHPVEIFAYPYGAVDARVAAQVARAGFRGAVLAGGGRRYSAQTPLDEPRILVDRGDDVANFADKVLGRPYRDTLDAGGPARGDNFDPGPASRSGPAGGSPAAPAPSYAPPAPSYQPPADSGPGPGGGADSGGSTPSDGGGSGDNGGAPDGGDGGGSTSTSTSGASSASAGGG